MSRSRATGRRSRRSGTLRSVGRFGDRAGTGIRRRGRLRVWLALGLAGIWLARRLRVVWHRIRPTGGPGPRGKVLWSSLSSLLASVLPSTPADRPRVERGRLGNVPGNGAGARLHSRHLTRGRDRRYRNWTAPASVRTAHSVLSEISHACSAHGRRNSAVASRFSCRCTVAAGGPNVHAGKGVVSVPYSGGSSGAPPLVRTSGWRSGRRRPVRLPLGRRAPAAGREGNRFESGKGS